MKAKKYVEGGLAEALDEYKPRRKPLPSETIKEDKRAKEINEAVRDSAIQGASPINAIASLAKRLKDNVMGTEEQNAAAEEREKARARANPEGNEAKFRRMMGKEFKSGGKVSSASKRADGCATKGKTRGRII